MTFGQLAKYTSHMYKNLTPEERAVWDSRASQDTARYDAEISSYVPPPGHDARGVVVQSQRPRKRAKRSPRDPGAPKRASGAYVFLTNEIRPQILRENPGIKFTDLGRILGQKWRSLTPKERKRYEDMAASDKIRFQMEMQEYTARQAATAQPPPPQVEQQAYQEPNGVPGVYDYSRQIPFDNGNHQLYVGT